jgi:cell volume regulation protein A
MGLGAVIGFGMGRAMLALINRLKLGYDGLYPVLTLSLVFLTFGLADVLGGSGFLAVYLAGIVLGQHTFLHHKSLLRFHDGLAWIMQITMFLTLGLLVFPSRLAPVAGVSLLIVACLMFVARPVSVFVSLLPSRIGWRAKALIAWVGLRGAAPIILATFPLLAQLPPASLMFNVVFFVVLTSVLLQGTSLARVAQWLQVDAPPVPKRAYPLEFTPMAGMRSELKELPVPAASGLDGRAIFELGLPEQFLVILIAREADFLQPSGGTVLQAGDTLLVLADPASLAEVTAKYHLPEA